MIRPILRYGEPPLHAPAADVATFGPDLHQLIDDMIATMYDAPGVGLAAPQIGVPLRIFVVDVSVGRTSSDLIVMVNPAFVERDGVQLEEEGCLSLPGFNATVVRPSRAVVRGFDRDGNEQTIEGRDLLREQGIETDYLRVRALPFENTTRDFIAAHDRLYVVENNTDGQMAKLLCMEFPDLAYRIRSLAHSDGLPLTARWMASACPRQ